MPKGIPNKPRCPHGSTKPGPQARSPNGVTNTMICVSCKAWRFVGHGTWPWTIHKPIPIVTQEPSC